MSRRNTPDMSEKIRSESASLALILTMLNAARRRLRVPLQDQPGHAKEEINDALDAIETEARRLQSQVARGLHTNPGYTPNPALVLYGNPPGRGVTIEGPVVVDLVAILGHVEQLKYKRTLRPKGYYFHDFAEGDSLIAGTLSTGQKVVVILNANGRPLWGEE